MRSDSKDTRAKEKKPKEPKEKKTKEKNSNEDGKKRRRFPVGLIILLVIILAIVGVIIYVNRDSHSQTTMYRGTIIGNAYCFYDADKDEITAYSISRGPRIIKNTDEKFAEYKAQLKPADTSKDRGKYADEVGAAMGSSFNLGAYSYIDENDNKVLFSYPSKGTPALWLYNINRKTVEKMLEGSDIKGLAYGNGIIYARNETLDQTLCYRVATSYSGDLISVMPVKVVTTKPLSFWYFTMVDLAKGVIKGFKASQQMK
ncbi:MAG: hypothetical protein IJM39_05990 [Firmicutes bacterium]|nr:hypothetical protein [Bacillota bacterium]